MGPLISKESVVLRDCKCKAPVIHCHPRAATVRKKNLFRERTGKNVPLVMYQSFHRHIFTHYLLITTSCLRSPWKERGLSWWQQKSAAWKGMWQQSPLGCMSQRAALAWAARRSKAPQSQSQQLELQKRVCWAHQALSLSQWIDTAMPGQIRLIQERACHTAGSTGCSRGRDICRTSPQIYRRPDNQHHTCARLLELLL